MLHYYLKRIKGVLCESKHTFFITSRSVHIRTRNISDNICREYQSTHFLLNSLFFENIAAYETMWKNFVQPNRSYVTTFCMHIAYLVPKATNTHSEYVTRTDFPLQQWLKERACVLRYTYIACLVEWYRRLWIQYWLWCDGRRILCISWSRNSMCYSLELSALLYLKWQTQLEMSRCGIRIVKRFRTCLYFISDFYSTWL